MAHQGWEYSDFPILCNGCLGENPYIRMTNMGVDKECKVCSRPFSVFRWSPGPNMRFRHTIVCQTCSKIRNCCQSCALDLTFAIPVGIRDSVLETTSNVPKSDINRQYFIEKMEKQINSSEFEEDQLAKTDTVVKELIKKVASNAYTPMEKSKYTKTCQNFIEGNCRRGKSHELPPNHQKSKIPSKFSPRANKRSDRDHSRYPQKGFNTLNIPSIIITGIPASTTEEQLLDAFQSYGAVKSVKVIGKSKLAFLTFESSNSAELLMATFEPFGYKITINDEICKLSWGKVPGVNLNKGFQQTGANVSSGKSNNVLPAVRNVDKGSEKSDLNS